MNHKIDANFLLELCLDLRPIFLKNNQKTKDFSLKKNNDPVTQTDLLVDQHIFNSLSQMGFAPNEILCEERPMDQTPSIDSLWIIDPLDGTKEFIQGLPEFAVSIAYRKKDKFVIGAIYNPDADFFASWDENGFFLKETSIPELHNHRSAILCSRSEWKRGLFEKLQLSDPIIPLGSIAYKLALVAAGKAKATISLQPKKSWDIAAGIALVEGNGGRVSDLKGNAIDFSDPLILFEKGLVATHRAQDLEKILRELE